MSNDSNELNQFQLSLKNYLDSGGLEGLRGLVARLGHGDRLVACLRAEGKEGGRHGLALVDGDTSGGDRLHDILETGGLANFKK